MKYDYELSLEPTTSLGKINAYIDSDSQILEFGPGNGRLTRHLTEVKNCQVSIVEFDKELYEHVMPYAVDGVLGDIDTSDWLSHFKKESFDYILFADVLEHVRNPKLALEKARKLLKPTGYILISFPNIAHNSVLIDLFNNQLNWKKFGLLDETHVSFYTQSGFEQLFKEINLFIHEEDYTYSLVGENEINSTYTQLPNTIQSEFRKRPYGEVYQYFFALAKNENTTSKIAEPKNSYDVSKFQYVYNLADGQEIIEPVYINDRTKENTHQSVKIPENIVDFRIVIIDKPSILDFSIQVNQREYTNFSTNAKWQQNTLFLFSNETATAEIQFPDAKALAGKTVEIDTHYVYKGCFSSLNEMFLEYIQQQKHNFSELYTEYQESTKSYEQKISTIYHRQTALSNTKEFKNIQKRRSFYLSLLGQETSKEKRTELVTCSIDSIENDPDTKVAIIKGWGFSNKGKLPLKYILPEAIGSYYKITQLRRVDVCDNFELPRDQKYGFIIEIENYQVDKYIPLIIKTPDKQTINWLLNKYNLNQTSISKRMRFVLGKVRNKGIMGTFRWAKNRYQNQNLYEEWIKTNEVFDLEKVKKEISNWKYQPKISVVTPVYNVEAKWLKRNIEAMQAQFYENWELCLADDASTEPHVRPLLEEYAKKDSRIKIVFRSQNGHISEATNSAIGLSSGEYVGFADNDDELAPNALYEVVKALNQNQNIDFIYTDEDKVDTKGKRFDPFFKPDWNATLLMGHNYITHFVVIRRDLLNTIGGLDTRFNGSQDYDFVLRATEKAKIIHHIPKILYHWRTVESSTASDPQTKEYAYVAGRKTLETTLLRRNISGKVTMTKNYGAYKIDYSQESPAKVSIIYTSWKNIKQNIEQLLNHTQYINFEIIIPKQYKVEVDNQDHRIIYAGAKELNQLAKQSTGKYLLFLSDAVRPKNADWLNEMVNYGLCENVGVVGGKVISSDDVVLDAGLSWNEKNKQLEYEQRGISNKSLGYYFRTVLPREVLAVTTTCLLVSKINFESVDGFDMNFSAELLGVDLSLKMQNQLGLKVIWQPYSELISSNVGSGNFDKKSITQFIEKWDQSARLDIYRNPNELIGG